MAEDREKLHKLEDVNRRLFSRDESLLKARKEKPLSKFSYEVPTAWATSGEEGKASLRRKGMSFFKKFFIFSLVVFVGAVGYALYKFGTGSNTFSANNLEIEITVNPFVESGAEIDIGVDVSNKNAAAIEVSGLTIEYQKGETLEGETDSSAVERKKIELARVDSFSSSSGSARIVLFGDSGSRRIIKAKLEYRISGSSAIFIKEAEREVLISSAPIEITVEAPGEITPGQDVNFSIKISSNSANVSKDMLVKAIYPFGFQFKESNPEPFSGDDSWFLGDLAPGSSKTISVKGVFLGDPGEERVLRVLVGEVEKGNQSEIGILYATALETVNLATPSLEAKLLITGKDSESYPISAGGRVRADIAWSNNMPVRMEDLEITIRMTGNAFNRNSVSTEKGLYNHLNDTITWNKGTIPELASIGPGDEGVVSFSFVPASTVDGTLLLDPSVVLEASIRGNKVNNDNSFEPISNTDREKTIKVISNLQVGAKALYSSGPISNTGPLPPKAGVETTYTIVWTVTNSNNDVDKAEVRAKLAPFAVKWVGQVSPAGEDIVYNEVTKEVIWRLGRVPRGTGIGSEPREIAFQLALEPFFSQIGTAPTLLGETVLTGEDVFAKIGLKNIKGALNTRLVSDPTFQSGNEIVVQ